MGLKHLAAQVGRGINLLSLVAATGLDKDYSLHL